MKKKIISILSVVVIVALFSGLMPIATTATKVDYSDVISSLEESTAKIQDEYHQKIQYSIELLYDVLQGDDIVDEELKSFLNEYEISDEEVQLLIDQLIFKLESNTFSPFDDKSVDETIEYLKENNMPIDNEMVELCREIETYKSKNPEKSINDMLNYFDGNIKNYYLFSLSVSAFSYDQWKKLNASEKVTVLLWPKEALVVDSCKDLAYQYTADKYGYNGLGDMSDGYRHGIWNALMSRDVGHTAASAFATAHEDIPTSTYNDLDADGYYKWQHRNMDLHNNEKGRDQVSYWETIIWGLFGPNDATLKTRISNIMTNKSSGIIWLHN